uniref:Uncharacterized protein n=1 Tax=Stegastes partitus TaxID=144197 RepID=A0A3B5BCI6_9TELE
IHQLIASELSALRGESGVPRYAPVTLEDVGTEVHNVRRFFNREIFLDGKRCFYGVSGRRVWGFLRLRVWMNGEGFVLVIGQGEQGILLERREMEFGDEVSTDGGEHHKR